jgi:transcriptional antiterminator RfaH
MSGHARKSWYLVYAKPRQEAVAQTNLERQGYETYFPRMRQVRRRAGRRVAVVGPMFPRYLFIHLDDRTDNWGPIRSTIGVVSIVRFGHQAARVPDSLISVLRANEGADGLQYVPEVELRPGSRVRVMEGSLSGFEGIYLAKSGRDRVIVLLDIMGKTARTALDSASVEPAGPSK